MKYGEKLHVFDQALCCLLCENLAQILDCKNDAMNRTRDTAMDGPNYLRGYMPEFLRDHLAQCRNLIVTKAVLDEEELLLMLFAVREIPDKVMLYWIPDRLRMMKWRDTVDECRIGLGVDEAKNWADVCLDFEGYFEDQLLFLGQGVVGLIEWIGELRQCLLAMDRLDLVPAMISDEDKERIMCRSLSRPDPKTAKLEEQWSNPNEKIREVMEDLRPFIRRLGIDAKPDSIAESAGGKRQNMLIALRCLEYLDEYAGFRSKSKTPLASRGDWDVSTD